MIASLARRLRTGEVTARDLAETALDAIEAVDKQLDSFVLVDRAGALEAADRADRELASGRDRGPLHGVPVGVKDIVDVAGLATRCGSATYPDTPAAADAPVITRLRAAGAVIVGKTTAHELACGVYSSPASNPWDVDRVPGGSSGGSGAAVAAGLVPMALGSDTGGSIRIPAGLCGVAGLKPTFGVVPKSGVEALAWSLDHIGPLASTVEDCALTMDAIADGGGFATALGTPVAGMRVGVAGNRFTSPAQDGVVAAFEDAIGILAGLGAEPVKVDVPELEHTLAAEFGIVGPEAAAFHRERLRREPEAIDPGIRALLVAGSVLPADHYVKAQQARGVIRNAVRRAFENHYLTALVTPTLPATAAAKDQTEFDYDGTQEDVTLSYVRTTAPFNLSGQPALSVPCGFVDGLPVGLQIATMPFADGTALAIGAAYEAATSWHEAVPPVAA